MLAAIGHFLVVVGICQHESAGGVLDVSSRRAHDSGNAFDSVAVALPASIGAVGVWRLLGGCCFHC